jgi:hypothetical protein
MIAGTWILAATSAMAASPATTGFGADVGAAAQVGSLIGSWPVPGVHGAPMVRYDAYAAPVGAAGPRVGASLWGTLALWPLQESDEDGLRAPLHYNQYGLMVVLRPDAADRVGFTGGMGFSRVDLADYHGGPQVLAALGFEGGARFELPPRGGAWASGAFVDALLRVHWSTSRSPTADDVLHEWWMVQLAVGPGLHLR